MEVEMLRIIANGIEKKKPAIHYTEDDHVNITICDGRGKPVNLDINNFQGELRLELEFRARTKSAKLHLN
jgi:hypothetical protein